jgi:hypothetical protein
MVARLVLPVLRKEVGVVSELDKLREAAAKPFECHKDCKCLCHDFEIEDPGPTHLATCAWADPDFPVNVLPEVE